MIRTRPDIPERFWQLLDLLCQQTLSQKELEELESLLRGHADRQRALFDYCRLHTDLSMLADARVATQQVRSTLQNEPNCVELKTPVPTLWKRLGRSVPGGEVFVGGLLVSAVAAAFWGIITLGTVLLRADREPVDGEQIAEAPAKLQREEAGAEEGPPEAPSVAGDFQATLTAISGNWASDSKSWRPGDRLPVGQLALDRGVAELTFDSGARVVLEGPGVFLINDSNSGDLQFGKLLANVPHSAVGFRVNSPTANVVDLGTEFAIEVARNGAAEVHVLEGAVQLLALNDPQASPRILRKWQGAAVSAAGLIQRSFTAQPSRFRHSVDKHSRRYQPLPVVAYQYTSAILPNAQPHRSDNSLAKLTDGIRGSFNLNDGLWVGFADPLGLNKDDGTPQPGIRFKLKSAVQSIDAVRVTYLLMPFSAVHAPTALRVRSATQQATLPQSPWHTLIGFDDQPGVPGLENNASGTVKTVTLDLPRLTGPWIELEFENAGEWTYLSEITLLHGLDESDDALDQGDRQ